MKKELSYSEEWNRDVRRYGIGLCLIMIIAFSVVGYRTYSYEQKVIAVCNQKNYNFDEVVLFLQKTDYWYADFLKSNGVQKAYENFHNTGRLAKSNKGQYEDNGLTGAVIGYSYGYALGNSR